MRLLYACSLDTLLTMGCVMLRGVVQEDGAIRAGDQLVEVQGESVKGKDFDEVSRPVIGYSVTVFNISRCFA